MDEKEKQLRMDRRNKVIETTIIFSRAEDPDYDIYTYTEVMCILIRLLTKERGRIRTQENIFSLL